MTTTTAAAADNPPPPPPQRGAARVFNRMREAIVNGDYHFNQRLPSERALAERYSTARGTVRAALRQLEQANLVRRQFGSGAFVAYNSLFEHDDIAEGTSPLELIETRLAIEPHIVKLVVTNASNRDLRRLEQALNHVLAHETDPNAFSVADEAFHLMLAHCSQNPLLIWMYQRINDIRAHNQWNERKNNILSPQKIAHYNQQHTELLRLITRRDTEAAARAMTAHLNQAKKDLQGSY